MKFVYCFFVFSLWQAHGYYSHFELALKKLDAHVQKNIQNQKIVGCSVAVIHQHKIVFMKSYGLRRQHKIDQPVTFDTVFQLGSISKPITSTLICIMHKNGLLNLDDAIDQFYPKMNPNTKIRHLLNHTSGFPKLGWNHQIEMGTPRQKMLDKLVASTQQDPQQKFSYHNLAYSLIEDILKKTQQQTFKEIIREKLFAPLKMDDSTVGYADFLKQNNRAWPHYQDKKNILRPYQEYSKCYHNSAASAGGVNSNIKDMAQFLKIHLNGIPGVLDISDLEPFHTPSTEAPDALLWFKNVLAPPIKSYYGLGWRIIDTAKKRIVFHGGSLNGFMNFLGFDQKSNVGIVILNNSDGNFSSKTGMLFLNTWLDQGNPSETTDSKPTTSNN